MYAIAKIDLIDKYSPKKQVKKTRYRYANKIEYTETYYEEEIQHYCKIGDRLKIITENPQKCFEVLVVENKEGKRFTIKFDDIKILSLDD